MPQQAHNYSDRLPGSRFDIRQFRDADSALPGCRCSVDQRFAPHQPPRLTPTPYSILAFRVAWNSSSDCPRMAA
jgi:hypothetical protein